MGESVKATWFENVRMGQRARLVTLPSETAGTHFVMEYVNRPFAGEFAVPAHVHPKITETFEILAGRAHYRLGRERHEARAGDRVVLPAGVIHSHPWSASDEELHVRQISEANPPDLAGLTAGLQAAITIFGLAGAGKVDAKGAPNALRLAVLGASMMPTTYLATPSIPVQRAAFSILGGVGRALGYRTAYPEYGVLTPRGLEVAGTKRG